MKNPLDISDFIVGPRGEGVNLNTNGRWFPSKCTTLLPSQCSRNRNSSLTMLLRAALKYAGLSNSIVELGRVELLLHYHNDFWVSIWIGLSISPPDSEFRRGRRCTCERFNVFGCPDDWWWEKNDHDRSYELRSELLIFPFYLPLPTGEAISRLNPTSLSTIASLLTTSDPGLVEGGLTTLARAAKSRGSP